MSQIRSKVQKYILIKEKEKKMLYVCVCVGLSVYWTIGNTFSSAGSRELSQGHHHHHHCHHHHHHYHRSGLTLKDHRSSRAKLLNPCQNLYRGEFYHREALECIFWV